MLFFLLFMTVWCTGHAYIALRMIRPLPPERHWHRLAWCLLVFSLVTVPAVFFGRMLSLSPFISDVLAWVAYIDMGFFLILLPLLVLRDLGLVSVRLAGTLRHRFRQPGTTAPDVSRRRFLANGMNLGLVGLTGAMTGAGYYEARQLAEVKDVTIPLAGLPDALEGFRIVQLSDIHLGPTIKGDYLQGIVERSNELEPDLVAITGDLADGLTSMMQEHVTPLESLRSRHGTFFVTGNHEYYWANCCAVWG
jgi:hypothetical protein